MKIYVPRLRMFAGLIGDLSAAVKLAHNSSYINIPKIFLVCYIASIKSQHKEVLIFLIIPK